MIYKYHVTKNKLLNRTKIVVATANTMPNLDSGINWHILRDICLLICKGESFKGYSLIQDFEADFLFP